MSVPPVIVGDRVHVCNVATTYTVKAVEGTWAWLFYGDQPSRFYPFAPLSDLTRVDDQATA